MNNTSHYGGCHCGQVFFEVKAPKEFTILECNCSICTKTGYQHLIVKKEDFILMRGDESLHDYQFNTKTAHHYFCVVCGVKSFYIPRSHPDSVSVNVRCLESKNHRILEVKSFDGQNWEKARALLDN